MTIGDDFNDVFDRESGATETAAPAADGVPRDDQGRFAPKAADAAPEVPPTEAPQAAPEPAEDRNANRHVPLSELLAERERFRKEKTLREELEKRATEHENRARTLEQLMQQQVQQRQAPQQPVQQQPAPDPYTDPEGWAQHQEQQQFIARRHDIANMSEAFARRTLGVEIVEKAKAWALQTPGAAQHFFMRAADPYGELVDAYKRQEAMQRIGPDPDAYEKQMKAKLREEILAELKTGQGKPQPRFPGTLADATASGAQGQHLTDEAVAAELFATGRNRRA